LFVKGKAKRGDEEALLQFGILKVTSSALGDEVSPDIVLVDALSSMDDSDVVTPDTFKYKVAQRSRNPGSPSQKVEIEEPIMIAATQVESTEKLRGSEALKRLENLGAIVNAVDLKDAIEELAKIIPKSDSYYTKELIVKCIRSENITFQNLLGCGTKVLDALLYKTYKGGEKDHIFNVHYIENVSVSEMSENINFSLNSFIAAVVTLYNRGKLVSKSSNPEQQRQLIELLKGKLFNGKITTEDELADSLSSSNTQKFPASALMKMDLKVLPLAYYNRAILIVAGTKAIRYSMMALRFERATPEEPLYIRRVEQAHALLLSCASKNSFDYAVKCHPLSNSQARIPRFTLRMTRAVIEYLSPKGRSDMRESIIQKDIRSFTLDGDLMGSETSDGRGRVYSILDDPEADFAVISPSMIEYFFSAAHSF
jgi:hypothetical protein